MIRNGIVRAAACAVVASSIGGSLARAAEPPRLTSSDLALSPADASVRPAYLQNGAAAPGDRTLLMGLLDQAGLAGPLDNANLRVFGRAEASYTYSFSNPPGDIISGRVFDFENEEFNLNQLAVVVERTVDQGIAERRWDVGGRMEWIYGSDSRLIHSLGLFDHYGIYNVPSGDDADSPDNQFDLNQAYVDIAVPVGTGLRLRLGKFITLLGQETIDPTGNALFSHSYLFGFSVPFTHTGVLGTYALNNNLSVDLGITRGWDTSLEDDNDTIDVLGRVTYRFDDRTSALVSFVTGPDQPGDNDDWRTVLDVILLHKVGDDMAFAVNGDVGYEGSSVSSPEGDSALWWGVAGYASYTLTPMATVNARLEYFNDDDGARLMGAVGGGSVAEATIGLAITPFPEDRYGKNLVIRPEIRYDWATKPFFDGGTDRYQFTAGIDAYYRF